MRILQIKIGRQLMEKKSDFILDPITGRTFECVDAKHQHLGPLKKEKCTLANLSARRRMERVPNGTTTTKSIFTTRGAL